MFMHGPLMRGLISGLVDEADAAMLLYVKEHALRQSHMDLLVFTM
jgi:hypothetical protein